MTATMVTTVWFAILTILSVLALPASSSAFPSTVPAFLWTRQQHPLGDATSVTEAVTYQTLSMKDLVKAVMFEGGWSNLLCPGKHAEQSVNLALIFVGTQLQSSDVSKPKKADPVLLEMLKASLANSNFSLAFPYVAASDEEAIESSLISEIRDLCGQDLELSNIAFSESCSLDGERFKKLADLHAVQDHLVSSAEMGSAGPGNVVVFCHGGSGALKHGQHHSEGDIFSELISSVERLDTRYTALYVSDPFRSIQYPSHREVERFLAEGAVGNGSVNSTMCDGVCQIKSSLLEGLFVGLVLLVILISGLCCMMGIDTPSRFETPQDS